jgi:hypothetical protein
MHILHRQLLPSLLIAATLFVSTATVAQIATTDHDAKDLVLDEVLADVKSAAHSFYLNGGSFAAFPIPANTRMLVHYTAAKAGTLDLTLKDTNGMLVAPAIQAEVLEGEERKFAFDVSGLANGMYVLRAEQNALTLARRVIVAH